MKRHEGLSGRIWMIVLGFAFPGANGQLLVSALGATQVDTLAGANLTLAISFSGAPDPSITWFKGRLPVITWAVGSDAPPDMAEEYREVLRLESNGSLSFVQVPLGYDGIYTVEMTKSGLGTDSVNFTLRVFEKPPGSPQCSVLSEDNRLRYDCQWSGGTPPARLSFPDLSEGSGLEIFTLTVNASGQLDGKIITCQAEHLMGLSECNVTAKSPQNFLPTVTTDVDSEGNIVVSISCLSRAAPPAAVSWLQGIEPVVDGNLVSDDTNRLHISHRNVSEFLLQNYTCTCQNLLGTRTRHIHLQEPSISNFNLFLHKDGTIVTLTWEVPPTSIVTGFDIQMRGPPLRIIDGNVSQSKSSADAFRTVLVKPGSARSADVFHLDPKSTYRFRVLPRALMTEGQPTEARRIGPAEGLSGPAIAGIAAGIPCSLLFLLLMCGLIYLCIYWSRAKRRQTRYPVSRAVEKVTTTQTQTPHSLLPGGPKSPPDYNRLRQTPSSLSVTPPLFAPQPPVRVATRV